MTNVMTFKIFSPKNFAKNGDFSTKTASFCKKCFLTLFFSRKKTLIFAFKMAKIYENSGYNIAPPGLLDVLASKSDGIVLIVTHVHM
jgi:hypothetical protein